MDAISNAHRKLAYFRLEVRASRSGRRKKDRSGKSRELERRRVEDLMGKAPYTEAGLGKPGRFGPLTHIASMLDQWSSRRLMTTTG